MPSSTDNRSEIDPSDLSLCPVHSLSEVEEDTSDSEIAIDPTNRNEATHHPLSTPIPICVTPTRLPSSSNNNSTNNYQSLLSWTSPGTVPFATVISSSPSVSSLILPFAQPVSRSPPRFVLPRRNSADKTKALFDDETEKVPESKMNGVLKENITDAAVPVAPQTTLVPVASVRTGIERKANPLQLQSWCQLLLTLDGRDKVTKLLQYWSRLLAWWLVSGSAGQKRADSLKASLTNSRKAFRLGRSLLEMQKLSDQGVWEWFLGSVSSYSSSNSGKENPAWKVLGNALKTIGLLGFWAFDNASFLTGSGVVDDFSIHEPKLRVQKRQQLAASCSKLANRSYFVGGLAGLVVSWRSYLEHREKLRQLLIHQDPDDHDEEKVIRKAKQEQFVLFLALVKSCCDVLAFSNNPGVDIWTKVRGKKMHEGVHCLAGLLSASTVLYNKYPDANAKKQ